MFFLFVYNVVRIARSEKAAGHIFGLVGGAIGEEILAMLKAKDDMKEATDVATLLAKKDQAKYTRARDITALITTGSEILYRLEQLGPNEMLRLKIDELHALLVNVDPQGSTPKRNKKIWQEKASFMPTG